MELLVAADSLFLKTSDGKYWSKTIYGYDFWKRYLLVFEDIVVVSRTRLASVKEVNGSLRVDGPNVRVAELPYMRGMKQYMKNYLSFCKAAKEAVRSAECALMRLPSVSAFMVLKYYKRKGLPYALEVVADPYYAYASNKIAQTIYTKKLKEAVLKANGVSYVTEYYLQNMYPSYSRINGESDRYFESHYSTINLQEEYFALPRKYRTVKRKITIAHTANNINNDIKGHEVLIKIIKRLRDERYDASVIFIGDGSKRKYYEQMSRELGLREHITFTGLLSSQSKVREILIDADLFVFPTKAEGLPRAVIEAMAVGLPCLSTPVGGIPELLKEEYLLNPTDVDGFVNKIIELINNPKKLEEMSNENINTAKRYLDYKLAKRRVKFYSKLRELAE